MTTKKHTQGPARKPAKRATTKQPPTPAISRAFNAKLRASCG